MSDFFDYLQSLAGNKKISIKKFDDKFAIILFIEVLAKQQILEIDLSPTKKDTDTYIKEIYQDLIFQKKRIGEIDDLKKDNEELKNENKLLKEKIENQDKEINDLKNTLYDFMNKSVIMKEDEKSLLFTEIENKMNKKVHKLKKLYQATIDGGNPINFHKKSDNIPNNPIKESKLHTMKYTFNYKEDKTPFSEIEGRSLVKAMEYEVFQAIFN